MTEPLVSFVVPGNPKGKGRPRTAIIAGRARIYTPSATASEEGAFRLFAFQAMRGRAPFEGPLRLMVTAWVQIPASWSRPQKAKAMSGLLYPVGRSDLDNVIKLVSDSMNSVVFRDDSQIVTIAAQKRYSDIPRVAVEVSAQ